jgi:hypothetical protein
VPITIVFDLAAGGSVEIEDGVLDGERHKEDACRRVAKALGVCSIGLLERVKGVTEQG